VNSNAEIPNLSIEARAFNSICQGERWERVDCKLEQRRGAYRLRLQKPHVCFAEVCRRHGPSKVNNEQLPCHGLFISSRPSKLNNEEVHCHGLSNTQKQKAKSKCIDNGLFNPIG
jgi:hypothetical protein